ncbi:MAG TPA: TIGR02253 family HAD-type hydrolase [Candidatus Altiarchaeales archaeon]|nr:TIGR02253 family HAD-type hydrolase [Candidatus Altiarchaeales archaeon]
MKKEKRIKAVFFDIDNCLYDTSLQAERARKNAIKAMINAGLAVDEKKAYALLMKIVRKYGSNYGYHFDRLLEALGFERNPRIIAAGIVGYHTTKLAYLVPFPDTVPTLLQLRDMGYKLGIITNGLAIKQWEKLIRLGLQHFFHSVIISEEVGCEKPERKIFEIAAKSLAENPEKCVMVGDRLDIDIEGAKKAGMVTIQIVRSKKRAKKPKNEFQEPDFIIGNLKELVDVLNSLQ